MRNYFISTLLLLTLLTSFSLAAAGTPSMTVGTFPQEVRREFTVAEGFPVNAITSVAVLDGKSALAGTANGLARFAYDHWTIVNGTVGAPVEAVAGGGATALFALNGRLLTLQGDKISLLTPLPPGLKVNAIRLGEPIYLATDHGLFEYAGDTLKPVAALNDLLKGNSAVFQVAVGSRVVIGAAAGLFQRSADGKWTRLFPADKSGRSWAPINVRGVAYDTRGRLWFASPQGVGRFDKEWTLFTGSEGLPYNDFTTMAAGENGVVWFGTRVGAIRYDGLNWEYREGRRWVPDDVVNGIAVTPEGNAWFAIAAGLSLIERRLMTLAEKAVFYENQIDTVHRRTPWEYVLEVSVATPGTTNQFTQK